MPDFFCWSDCAASCQVRPSESAWCNGRMPAQVSKTFLTLGSVQSSLPAIRLTWKS